jgi:hypothetical protein
MDGLVLVSVLRVGLVFSIGLSGGTLLAKVLLLLQSFLLRELLLELFLVVNLLEAVESCLGGTAAVALHQVHPHEVGALGLRDLLRS